MLGDFFFLRWLERLLLWETENIENYFVTALTLLLEGPDSLSAWKIFPFSPPLFLWKFMGFHNYVGKMGCCILKGVHLWKMEDLQKFFRVYSELELAISHDLPVFIEKWNWLVNICWGLGICGTLWYMLLQPVSHLILTAPLLSCSRLPR